MYIYIKRRKRQAIRLGISLMLRLRYLGHFWHWCLGPFTFDGTANSALTNGNGEYDHNLTIRGGEFVASCIIVM